MSNLTNSSAARGAVVVAAIAAGPIAAAVARAPLVPALLAAAATGLFVALLFVRSNRAVATSRLAEERYRRLVDEAVDLIYTHDLDFNVTSVNRAVEPLTGYTLEEAIRMNMRDVLAPESRRVAEARFDEKRHVGGGSSTYEVTVVTKDGRRVPFEVSTHLVRDDGVVVGVQGTARDVSERARVAEEAAERGRLAALAADVGRALTVGASLRDALQECAEALDRHLGSSIAGVWTVRPGDSILELQGSAGVGRATLPRPARVAIGEFRVGRVASERSPLLVDLLDATERRIDDGGWAAEAGMVAFAGYPLVVGDRLVGVIALFASEPFSANVLDAIGSVANEIALGVDRAWALDELASSEIRFRSLFEHAPVGIYRTTVDGRVLNANPALLRMLGYADLGELAALGRPAEWLGAGLPRDAFLARLDRDGLVRNLETTWTRRDGSTFVANENTTPVRSASGEILSYEGTVEDVTERTRAAEATRGAHEAALESARVKSRFVANMSHEIRTPLNGILGMTQLVRATELTARQTECIDVIRECGDMLLAIVDDVLDLAKIEAHGLEIEAIELEPAALVESAVRIIETRARDKGLDLVVDVSADVPSRLRGDPTRIRQVLTNLLGNAVKFTDYGLVAVRVFVEAATPAEVTLGFQVTDTGVGIAPDALGRLFQPFVQADTSSTRKFGGTGLDLAISRDLVGLMGGTIGVESEPVVGSTFHFSVPLARVSEDAERRTDGVDSVRGPFDVLVLLADDDEVSRVVAATMLESLGCRVAVAADGREAARALEAEPFDMVFMDCAMPVMDGYDATVAIRTRGAHARRRIPIVALTAGALESDRRRCLAAGMDDHVGKPVLTEALASALGRWAAPSNGPRLAAGALYELRAARETERVAWSVLASSSATLLDELAFGVRANDRTVAAAAARRLALASRKARASALAAFCDAIAAPSAEPLDAESLLRDIDRLRAVFDDE